VNFFKKRVLLLTLGVVVLVSSGNQTLVKASSSPFSYVALGDSLAAGQTPYQTIGLGYTDLIADSFEHSQPTKFTKAFAVPGYTSKDVLYDIINNRTIGENSIQNVIREAHVLTLTVGANDLLKEATIDPENGTVEIDPDKVPVILATLEENLSSILKEIQELNPNVMVYVSDYYFPFIYLPDNQQQELRPILSALNNTIEKVSVGQGVFFVSLSTVDTIFELSPITFVPNPLDIHPSIAGYRMIANAFLDVIQNLITEAA